MQRVKNILPVILFLIPVILTAELSPDEDHAVTYDINASITTPRANALGGAFEAVADDSSSAYHNPAGLGYLYSMNIDLGGGILSAGRMFFNLGYSHPLKKIGVLFLGIRYFRSADMEESDANGTLLGKSFSSQDVDVTLSFGRRLDEAVKGLSAGLKIDYLYNTVLEEGFNGISLSYGVYYSFLAIPALRHLSSGLVLENLPGQVKWSTGRKDDIQTRLKFGLAYRFFRDLLLFSGHIVYVKDLEMEWALGTELNYKGFFFRVGGEPYYYNTGIGFRYQVYEINYAFHVSDLGNDHLFSLNYKFGGAIEEETRSRIMQEIIISKGENYYNDALFHYENGRYYEALQNFRLAQLWNPEIKDVEERIKEAEKKVEELQKSGKLVVGLTIPVARTSCPSANELLKHYYSGINAYMENNIETALKEWRYVASCDPNNEKVKINIKKAEIRLKEISK
ncbi:MAG: hypothetical protein PHF84_05315 [bacterium]|nr:hypothetical protein [bacterium]